MSAIGPVPDATASGGTATVGHATTGSVPPGGVWSSDPLLGRSGDNVPHGQGTDTVLDQASGIVPSRVARREFLVANQYSIVRFRLARRGSIEPVRQTEVYRGAETQFEALARGDAPVTGAPDRVLAFQASDQGERSTLVVFAESRETGRLTREASYPLATAEGVDLPNVEAVLYEPTTRRAWFFSKAEHPTRIFHVDFSRAPVHGVFRADRRVGEWSWQIDVPISGSNCTAWERVPLAPTDAHVDHRRRGSVIIVANQLYRQRPAAVLAVFRRPVGGDWRDIGADRTWRAGQVQFGTGSDACFPDDFAGLGVEAVTYRRSRLTDTGRVAKLVLVQDNTPSNEIASRRIRIP